MKVSFEEYNGGFEKKSPFTESISLEAERKLSLEDYYNNFGLLSSINDDGAMTLLREMMASGNVELYSRYCIDRNVKIIDDSDDRYENFIKSLDVLVSQAVEIAKSEDKNLVDFKKKILEIYFFKTETREKLKMICENDNALRIELERLRNNELEDNELKKLKN